MTYLLAIPALTFGVLLFYVSLVISLEALKTSHPFFWVAIFATGFALFMAIQYFVFNYLGFIK